MGRHKTLLEDHMAKPEVTQALKVFGYSSWQDCVFRGMSAGMSRQEVKAILYMSNDLFTRFMKDEPEFAETVKRGDEVCEAWWMSQGRENLKDKNFSPVLWYMNMKNRFGWKDKQEVDHTTKGESINKPADKNTVDAFIEALKNDTDNQAKSS